MENEHDDPAYANGQDTLQRMIWTELPTPDYDTEWIDDGGTNASSANEFLRRLRTFSFS